MGLSSPIAALAPKLFIDYVTKSKRLDYALWVIVAMLLHRLLWQIVSNITNVYEDYATNNVIIHVKRQIMMGIAQIDMAYFDNPESYNMIKGGSRKVAL